MPPHIKTLSSESANSKAIKHAASVTGVTAAEKRMVYEPNRWHKVAKLELKLTKAQQNLAELIAKVEAAQKAKVKKLPKNFDWKEHRNAKIESRSKKNRDRAYAKLIETSDATDRIKEKKLLFQTVTTIPEDHAYQLDTIKNLLHQINHALSSKKHPLSSKKHLVAYKKVKKQMDYLFLLLNNSLIGNSENIHDLFSVIAKADIMQGNAVLTGLVASSKSAIEKLASFEVILGYHKTKPIIPEDYAYKIRNIHNYLCNILYSISYQEGYTTAYDEIFKKLDEFCKFFNAVGRDNYEEVQRRFNIIAEADIMQSNSALKILVALTKSEIAKIASDNAGLVVKSPITKDLAPSTLETSSIVSAQVAAEKKYGLDPSIYIKTITLLERIEKIADRLDTESKHEHNAWQRSSMQSKANNIREKLFELNLSDAVEKCPNDQKLFNALKMIFDKPSKEHISETFDELCDVIEASRNYWDVWHWRPKSATILADHFKSIGKEFSTAPAA